MKEYSCRYLKANGDTDTEVPQIKFEAASVEEAAQIFAEQYPSEHPKIAVKWGRTQAALAGAQVVDNPGLEVQQEEPAVGTPRHPPFTPQSGKSHQPSSVRSSEVSEVVSYLERIHYWIRFMGVVLLIQIILAVILMFFLGVAD